MNSKRKTLLHIFVHVSPGSGESHEQPRHDLDDACNTLQKTEQPTTNPSTSLTDRVGIDRAYDANND